MEMSLGGVDVFGAEAEAYHAGGDAAEDGEVAEEREGEWESGDWCFEGEGGADEAFDGRRIAAR